MVSGHLLMFVYPHQGELCDDVTSTQYRVESYNMCQTGMGPSLCLLIHLMASWPEYLSYCKRWPVSLNQLRMMKNAHCLLLCDIQGHIVSVLMYVVLRGCSLEVEVKVEAASHH